MTISIFGSGAGTKQYSAHIKYTEKRGPFGPEPVEWLDIYHRVLKPVVFGSNLPDPRLEQEVTAAFQTNTCFQEALESVALPVKAVDDFGA